MNNHLAPTHQIQFGEYWVLWFEASNTYSVIDDRFKSLLEYYLNSESKEALQPYILKTFSEISVTKFSEEILEYLQTCNTLNKESNADKNYYSQQSKSKAYIRKSYKLNTQNIEIIYDSELVLKIIHPQIAHLEQESTIKIAQSAFQLYLDKDQLVLTRDSELLKVVPKREYHLIQGKLISELLCISHNQKEEDWIGNFHGSTISDGTNSILFIGNSGSGKSTLCALLMAHGFELVADDVSPLLLENGHLYSNPIAISVKKGAFDSLSKTISGFSNLPITLFNKNKGEVKYLPSPSFKYNHYPCKAIVLVNYQKGSETELKPTQVKPILETLIPESWLVHNALHAKHFLNWLGQQQMFSLSYSNTESVTDCISNLFKSL